MTLHKGTSEALKKPRLKVSRITRLTGSGFTALKHDFKGNMDGNPLVAEPYGGAAAATCTTLDPYSAASF